MPDVEGIVVELTTSYERWAGTDDHLYVGIYGTEGGREFNLDVAGFNDYERSSKVNYEIGERFEYDSPGPEKTPIISPTQLTAGSRIGQESVTHVYLRKHGQNSVPQDDAWKLAGARVWLFSRGNPTRLFFSRGAITLSLREGLQVWLKTGPSGGPA